MNEAVLESADNTLVEIPESLIVRLHGRDIQVRFTPRARRAAAELPEPLLVEMELYFSCLVRKRVLVRSPVDSQIPREDMVSIGHNLLLGFRPVVTEQCRIDDLGDQAPPLKTMPVKRPQAYIPHWLTLDVHHAHWSGEFGYLS